MRRLHFEFRWGRVLAGFLVAASVVAHAGRNVLAAPASDSAPGREGASASACKAVFAEHLPGGRDPFFPQSQRRNQNTLRVEGGQVVSQASAVLAQLVLKGIALGQQRRLALINGVTLAQGEKARVRVENGSAHIVCQEIRERSVLVGVVGSKETREIHLREEM